MSDAFALLFDHPEGEDWYWSAPAERIAAALPHTDPRTLTVIESALDGLPDLMSRYSAWQIATGFEFLFNNVLSLYPFMFEDERFEEADRIRTAEKLFRLFDIFFRETAHWSGGPAHLQSVPSADPVQAYVNIVCYMFWDSCPLPDFKVPALRAACIGVMERCLGIPNNAVIESALHGLGHLAPEDARATALATDFAGCGLGPPELIAYARAASAGYVQ